MKSTKIPKELKAVLWSYNIDKLKLYNPKDKHLIITQVLNYGSFDTVKWLSKTYSLEDIRSVIRKPSRGIWLKRRLDYWLRILDIGLQSNIYEQAILNLNVRAK